MLNEMLILRSFADLRGCKYMDFLPILPHGVYSKRYKEFRSIFDPATWGQFLDGTPLGKGISFVDTEHYIGKEIQMDASIGIVWKTEFGYRIPFLKKGNEFIKINNLHIHSKRLFKFLSLN